MNTKLTRVEGIQSEGLVKTGEVFFVTVFTVNREIQNVNLAAECPFCAIATASSHQRVVAENKHAFLVRDAYPVSNGHSLVMPKRHIGSFFEATDSERLALLKLLDQARSVIDSDLQPDAYNIGINDGVVAGQTIPHMHIHLIPRYECDVADPRGGVRWVVPEHADYWSALLNA